MQDRPSAVAKTFVEIDVACTCTILDPDVDVPRYIVQYLDLL